MVSTLVVDDDQGIRETVSMVLEDAGYRTTLANDGHQALACLRTSPDRLVVLLDQFMPKLDGLAVLEEVAGDEWLRARHGYVLLTASPNTLTADERSLLTTLSADILAKPFDIDVLVEMVRQVAERLAD